MNFEMKTNLLSLRLWIGFLLNFFFFFSESVKKKKKKKGWQKQVIRELTCSNYQVNISS